MKLVKIFVWIIIILILFIKAPGCISGCNKTKEEKEQKKQAATSNGAAATVVNNYPKEGVITLNPGGEGYVYLDCRTSYTRVKGGCVEISFNTLKGFDCPGEPLSIWRNLANANCKVINVSPYTVTFEWGLYN